MTTDNVIEVRFGNSTLVSISPKYRYDSGWIMKFVDLDLPESYQVHFGNTLDGDTIEVIGDSNGVEIPDILWTNGEIIYCWLYLHPTEHSSITKKEVRIAVGNRGKLPAGVTPEPQEQTIIDQLIGALNSAVEQTGQDAESAEQAKDDAESARDNAQTYANNAQSSAQASARSAESASESARVASTSATASAQSANQSAQIKADVEDLVDDAQSYAESALIASQASVTARNTAQGYAQSASASAQSASTNASDALTYANTASTKASEASTSAQTASTKATESAQSASQALSYKTDAESAKTASQTAQGLAESAKDSAISAKNDAESARDAVQSSAAQITTNAEDITQLKEDFNELVVLGNLFGLDNIVYNAKLSSGELADNAGTIVSDYIDVSDIDQVYFSQKPVYAALYDDAKTFISQATSPSSPWSTTNYGTKASFIRVCIYPDDANVFIVSKSSTLVNKYWWYPTKAISDINVDKQIADYFVANDLAKTDFDVDHVVFASCAGNMTPKYSQGNRHSVYAVNRIGTAIDIRMYGSDSFSVEGLAQVKVSVFIPDATKINSITLQLMGTSYSRPASVVLVDGWNELTFNTWEGTITTWTTATAIRITANGSEGIEFYVGRIKFVHPTKANMIIIEDGGYSTFYETAYPMFKTINVPITWALNPGRLNADAGDSGHVISQAEIDVISSDACSEFSFHSWKADPTSSMTVAELQADAAKCITYLRKQGLAPEHIWRAAHTQNLASNAYSERGMVEALATSTGLATYTIFPFANRWNIPRVQLHGRTSEFYTTMFDTLKKTHCTAVVYTHGVSTYSADITLELLNDFVTKLTAAINEGWLNPTTYNRLVNDNMTLYD